MAKAYTFSELVEIYYTSYDYGVLKPDTASDYSYYARRICSVKVGSRLFGDMDCEKINTPVAQKTYEYLVVSGVSLANHVVGFGSIVFGHSIRLGHVNHNPFSYIKRRSCPTRKVIWSDDHIAQFLTTAYGEFKWRNIGLIVQMAYEYCQRLGDMRLLKWPDYDLDTGVLTLEQSKRGAKVILPTSQGLQSMLRKQNEDFGFQEWIVPRPKPRQRKYKPYTMRGLSFTGKQIREAAGLPDTLQMRDLRRTGTTELVEAGVDLPQIMSVTGHGSPASVTPYIVNSLKTSTLALKARWDSKE